MRSIVDTPAAKPQPPKEVRYSFWLWIAGAALTVAGIPLLYLQKDSLYATVWQTYGTAGQAQRLTAEQIRQVVNLTLGVSTVVLIVFAGLYVLFGYKMLAGRNWARVTLTVLTVISVVAQLASGSAGGWIGLVVSIGGAALMYTHRANEYFGTTRVPGRR
ncbi:MAG: hypothetical protein J2O49_08660 [Sciscionella sp.]|nr:hypothetical protein [Sciscionella sp.]